MTFVIVSLLLHSNLTMSKKKKSALYDYDEQYFTVIKCLLLQSRSGGPTTSHDSCRRTQRVTRLSPQPNSFLVYCSLV